MIIRDATGRDHAGVLALNNGAVPHVNALTAEEFAWIVEHAGYFRVGIDAEGLAGFVIAFPPGLDYWSLNYRWFTDHYKGEGFFYLDRVVVAERARRHGVARALYDDIGRFVAGTWPRIALEVNLLPPNPGSLAFHERLGFRRVGVREEENGAKAVALMERAATSTSGEPDRGDRSS